MFLAKTFSIQKFSIRYPQPQCIFSQSNLTIVFYLAASNTLLTGPLSCIGYQLWIQTSLTEASSQRNSKVTPLLHCWHVLWSCSQSGAYRPVTRKTLLTQWRARYHCTGIWLYYGSRLLWKGSGWDSLMASLACRDTIHTSPAANNVPVWKKKTFNTNYIQTSLCSATAWTGQVSLNLRVNVV